MLRAAFFAIAASVAMLAGCNDVVDAPAAFVCDDEHFEPSGQRFVAGSGAATPLARAAVALLAADSAGRVSEYGANTTAAGAAPRTAGATAPRRWQIAASVGSGGAIAALSDSAVDVGLLGRAATDAERAAFDVTPIAQTAVVIATTAVTAPQAWTTAELVALYRGQPERWPDGSPIRLFVREAGDSAEALIAGKSPALAAAMADARISGRAGVAWSDEQLRDALASTPGAVGPVDQLQLTLEHLAVVVPTLDGVTAEAATVRRRTWPFIRHIEMLTRRDCPADTRRAARLLALAMRGLAAARGAHVPR